MEEQKKYFEVKNKYLAEGLAFLGFKYYKFQDKCDPSRKQYTFEETPEIIGAINQLVELKRELSISY